MNKHAPTPARARQRPEVDANLGRKVRLIREQFGYSQRELARRAGMTHTAISLIENGRISPSLSSLKMILDAVEMTLSEFFADNLDLDRRRQFFRAGELRLVAKGRGLSVFQVSDAVAAESMQVLVGRYEPGGDTGEDMLRHEGEEIGVIASGTFEVTVDGKTVVLEPGDAFHFNSMLPHRFHNVSDTEGVIIRAGTLSSI